MGSIRLKAHMTSRRRSALMVEGRVVFVAAAKSIILKRALAVSEANKTTTTLFASQNL